LAVRWPAQVPGRRDVEDLVGFVDLAPTMLEAAGLPKPAMMSGRSLLPLLSSGKSGQVDPARNRAFSGRERHSSSRYNNSAYPQRAMRRDQWLLIHNFRPGRWPAGTPRKLQGGELGPPHGGYHDIDACPTMSFLIEHHDDPSIGPFLKLATEKRPEYELFDLSKDPYCLTNLAGQLEHAARLRQLQQELSGYLRRTGDPRELDGGEVFETYRRYSSLRSFPPPGNDGG